MKLATYRDGSRDGQLTVVSRDLGTAHFATGMASRLGQLLDDWNFVSPQLEDLYATLNGGKARHAFPFDPARCMAPLPRPPGCWRPDGALRRERDGPAALLGANTSPLSDDRLTVDDPGAALAVEPGLALLMGDVPAGRDAAQALEGVRLVATTLCWSIGPASARPADPDPDLGTAAAAGVAAAADDAAGDAGDAGDAGTPGLWHALGSSFSPVAVTPDELPADWAIGGLGARLSLRSGAGAEGAAVPARSAGWCGDLGALVAGCLRWRPLLACQIVIAARGDALHLALRPSTDAARDPRAGWLARLEALDAQGQSIFGSIEAFAGSRG